MKLPDPTAIYPNDYGTSCYIKNVVHAPNIFIGDYTYYDDPIDPAGFEKNNILFNYPEFGDRLIICIAAGNPARCVKKRFDDELIALLQQYKWWDLSRTKLLDILPLLCDPDIEKLRKKIHCELYKTDESNLV